MKRSYIIFLGLLPLSPLLPLLGQSLPSLGASGTPEASPTRIVTVDDLRRHLVGTTWTWRRGNIEHRMRFLSNGTLQHDNFAARYVIRSPTEVELDLDAGTAASRNLKKTCKLRFDPSGTHFEGIDFDWTTAIQGDIQDVAPESNQADAARTGTPTSVPGTPNASPSRIVTVDDLRRHLVGTTWSWRRDDVDQRMTFLSDGTLQHDNFVARYVIRGPDKVELQLNGTFAMLTFDPSGSHYNGIDFNGTKAIQGDIQDIAPKTNPANAAHAGTSTQTADETLADRPSAGTTSYFGSTSPGVPNVAAPPARQAAAAESANVKSLAAAPPTSPASISRIVTVDDLRRHLIGTTWTWRRGNIEHRMRFLSNGTLQHDNFAARYVIRSPTEVELDLDAGTAASRNLKKTCKLRFDPSGTHFEGIDFDWTTAIQGDIQDTAP